MQIRKMRGHKIDPCGKPKKTKKVKKKKKKKRNNYILTFN